MKSKHYEKPHHTQRIVVKKIRQLRFNPLWLMVIKCSRNGCGRKASALFRYSVYLCSRCRNRLDFERVKRSQEKAGIIKPSL